MDPQRDVLAEFQAWFAAITDGEWEHQHGVTIETLDNPGWSLKIDLAGTELASRGFDRHEQRQSDDDWLVAWRESETFHAACGPHNLTQALQIYLDWATSP